MVELKASGTAASVALGCMNFGKRTPEPEAARILARAIERGVTVFDTANAYNNGESERILGRALAGERERFTIATKVGFGRVGGKPEGLSAEAVKRALDESLARLGTDYVDIYYLHVPDHTVPIEETLDAIEALRKAGKLRRFGVSNYAAWQILEMMAICDRQGAPRPVISQVMYNLLIRQIEIEYVGFTRKYPIHNTVYNPLAGGLLSGKHRHEDASMKGSRFDKNALYQGRYWTDRFFALVEAYRTVAVDAGMTLVDLSYAWLAAAPSVDSILVGPASLEHLDAAIDGVARALPAEVRTRIDEIHRAATGTDASYVR